MLPGNLKWTKTQKYQQCHVDGSTRHIVVHYEIVHFGHSALLIKPQKLFLVRDNGWQKP